MHYEKRLINLKKQVSRGNILLSSPTNIAYLTGFTGSTGLVVVTPGKAYFLTDFRYQIQASQEVAAPYEIIIAEKSIWKEVAQLLKHSKSKLLSFEAEYLTVGSWQRLAKK